MGAHAISQPGREFLCKIIELSLFAADFILSHVLLFLLLPVLCVPYIDRWHSVILFWLRPSRQIRAPIFSMKQNRLRKRIVRRYATLYFILFIIFCALIIGPLVAGMSIFKRQLICRKQNPNEYWWISTYELGSHSTQQWQSKSNYASQPQRNTGKLNFLNHLNWGPMDECIGYYGVALGIWYGNFADFVVFFKPLKD